MTLAWRRGTYYLQLEDDVVSKVQFVEAIYEFIRKQSKNDWFYLEFTQIGFIGKLFRTKDLPSVVSFFLMFAKYKPVDWLIESMVDVKSCNPEVGQVI